jgi:hypothetical protein
VKAAAIVLWVAAWFCAGLIPAAWFAARDGKTAAARAELGAGLIGAGGLAFAGAALW